MSVGPCIISSTYLNTKSRMTSLSCTMMINEETIETRSEGVFRTHHELPMSAQLPPKTTTDGGGSLGLDFQISSSKSL